ncbi:MAG: DUF4932 domain-containing protein, partial [Bacteroidota bacterium]
GPHADHPGLDSLRTARMYPDFTEVGLLLDGFPDASFTLPDSLSWYENYGTAGVEAMLNGLLAFARDADFWGFFQRHEADYSRWASGAETSLRAGGSLDAIDAFFRYGENRARPTLVVLMEPLNGWGAHAVTVPALLGNVGGAGTVAYQAGPAYGGRRLPDADLSFARDNGALAWHEAAHHYLIDPLDAHLEAIAGLERLFDAENPDLKRQNISTWDYAFEENLVRAIVVVLTGAERGEEAFTRRIQQQEARGFAYVGTLAHLIRDEYVANAAQYATFADFMPVILSHMGSLE